jgi:hypothetical protein
LHRLDERCGGYRVLCSSSHQYLLCTMAFCTLFYFPTFSVPYSQNHYRHLLFPSTKNTSASSFSFDHQFILDIFRFKRCAGKLRNLPPDRQVAVMSRDLGQVRVCCAHVLRYQDGK